MDGGGDAKEAHEGNSQRAAGDGEGVEPIAR